MSRNLVQHIIKILPARLRKKIPRKVKIVEVTARGSKKLNLVYRNKNKPTNVLSFRYDSAYGEILICPDVIRKEAKKQGNSYRFQMTWMIVHGILHLAGVHHERSLQQARRVEKIEEQILGQLFHS